MTITLNGTTGIQNVLGSAASPAESNTTNSNTGVYFPTSTSVGFSAAGAVALTVDASNNIFYTGGTERARIDSSGNLLVGTTDAGSSGGVGTKILPTAIYMVQTFSTNSNSNLLMYSTGAAAYRFYVDWGGTIHATATSIAAISDVTLKTNVKDLETGLTEVMALKPRRFDWLNGDATNVAGFIAQEVEQVLPELVMESVYSQDEEGNPITKKNLKMGDILPTLVKAIQEQQALITQLTDRIAALEAK